MVSKPIFAKPALARPAAPSMRDAKRRAYAKIYAALILALFVTLPGVARAGQSAPQSQGIVGTVRDTLGRPIAGASITLRAFDGRTSIHALTGTAGTFHFSVSEAGNYNLVVKKKSFRDAERMVIWPDRGKSFDVILQAETAITLKVSAARLRAQNGLTASGANKYMMTSRDITDLAQGEATPLNQVLLQMPGVALDQNQEIHIRGEHAGVQYQMNGIMLPLDINNDPTFTQLLNSYFVKNVSLIDGVLPAQFGYRTSGVIEISTKDGCDGSHNNFTIYGGQRDTIQPSFELGGCRGKLSYYLTGVYLHSNLGLSSATPAPDPIHDHTDQGQGFLYLTYALSSTTQLSLISGMTVATNELPNRPGLLPMFTLKGVNPAGYPSTTINSNIDQQDYYGVLALNGTAGLNTEYQLAYATHYNRENFRPDPISDLLYQGVAPDIFNSDFSNSLQGDLTYHLNGSHTVRGGFYLGEYGIEGDNTSLAFPLINGVPGNVPVSITSNLNRINLLYGVYLQDTWQMTEKLSVNFGTRWDRVSGLLSASQFSPTINFVYQPRRDTTLHAGFARNFQVPNFQGISAGIAKLQGTSGGVGPGLSLDTNLDAETDYTWDAGYVRRLTPRLVLAQDAYFRIDRHYLDEGQFGFIPLDAPFNYVRGYGAGVETSLTYNLTNLAMRANIFVAREEVRGVATGQFNFPPPAQLQYIDRHYIVLDHTPLTGASGGVAYRWREYQFTFDGLFSSGLRGGFANLTQLHNVWQFNLSASRTFNMPKIGAVENRIILLNILDRTNLIRPANGIGVFQSAYGPRLTVYDALRIPLPTL